MGGVQLPRRRRGAHCVSSEHTTDSTPRHRTSRHPRLVVNSAHSASGASPVSSILAGTAPVGGLRSSARPSASSARHPRTSARLPRTSAQPPTSSEGRPDGLGSRNEAVGRRSQRPRCALHAVATLREVLGACAEDLGSSLQVRGRVSERSERPFEAIGTTVSVLSATSQFLGRASHSLGALAHALGRTPQVVGNDRPCLESRSVVSADCGLSQPQPARTPRSSNHSGESVPIRKRTWLGRSSTKGSFGDSCVDRPSSAMASRERCSTSCPLCVESAPPS